MHHLFIQTHASKGLPRHGSGDRGLLGQLSHVLGFAIYRSRFDTHNILSFLMILLLILHLPCDLIKRNHLHLSSHLRLNILKECLSCLFPFFGLIYFNESCQLLHQFLSVKHLICFETFRRYQMVLKALIVLLDTLNSASDQIIGFEITVALAPPLILEVCGHIYNCRLQFTLLNRVECECWHFDFIAVESWFIENQFALVSWMFVFFTDVFIEFLC